MGERTETGDDAVSEPSRPAGFRYSRPGASWFEIDCPHDEARLSEGDQAFAAGLRARARRWDLPQPDCWTQTWEDDDDRNGVLAGLVVPAARAIFAAALVGTRLHCGLVHPQVTYFFRPWSAGLEIDADGTPDELVGLAADWLESVQRRPVVRYVWSHGPTVYAGRVEFADTGELLDERYDRHAAPPGEPEAMIAAGHSFGPGIVTTAGLSRPDAFVFLRGDRASARVPAGVPELPLASRSALAAGPGHWLGCTRG